MACLLKLVRLTDFAADIDELDLLSSGFDLAADGYLPTAAPYGATYVDETITLKITGTSKDDLAANIHLLDEKIKQVQWWMENQSVERYQVWLRSQLDNESLPRQAMLADIRPPDKVRVYNPVEINQNYIGEYTLGITRTAYWEDTYPYPTTTNKTGLNIIGGMVKLSETIRGDVSARLGRMSFVPDDQYTEVWAGWKTSRFGNPANFLSVWSLANALIIDSADTSNVADSSTYAGGNKHRTSFASDATLILRDRALLSDQTGNVSDQRGSYIVLLRAKMTDSSVARVQMVSGLYSAGTFQAPIFRSRVVISGTVWKIFELGTIKIPPSRLASNYTIDNFAIGTYAERISGSGSLDRDCLILIPYDDGAMKITSTGSVISTQLGEIFQAADQSLYASAQHNSGKSIYSVVPRQQGSWGVPANDEAPYLVVTANDITNGAVKGAVLDVSYTYIPRWRTLRGNET